MKPPFDPYERWLGIPKSEQPPTHYRLLGVEVFESRQQVIEDAAFNIMSRLHDMSAGEHVDDAQRLLNEVAAARRCLLDPQKRADYEHAVRSGTASSKTNDASTANKRVVRSPGKPETFGKMNSPDGRGEGSKRRRVAPPVGSGSSRTTRTRQQRAEASHLPPSRDTSTAPSPPPAAASAGPPAVHAQSAAPPPVMTAAPPPPSQAPWPVNPTSTAGPIVTGTSGGSTYVPSKAKKGGGSAMLVLVPAAVLFGLIAVAGVFAMLLSEDTTEAVASIHDDGKSPETNNPANHSSIGGTPQRGTDGFQPDSRGSSQESVALVSQDGGTGRSASNNRLEEGTDFGFPAPGQGTRGTGTAGSGSTSGSTFGQPRGSFSLPAPGDTPFDPPQSPVRANPDGLLAHWPLDDDSGELIRETVGGFHGKLYGKFLPAPGKVGQSLVFNGFSDYISVPGFQVAVDEVTCCAWVYRTKTGAWTGLLTGDGHVLGFSQYGKTVCYHWPSPAKVHSWPGPVVPNDEWIFVAVAIEPTKATAYLWSQGTGLQSKVNAVAHPSHNLDNLEIGRQNLENDSYFSGRLDDIRIYSRALTEVEIQALVDTAG